MILEHPYGSPSNSITLPNPDLGNPDIIKNSITAHMTMSGNMFTYVRKPSNHKLVMTFKNIDASTCSLAIIDDLKSFLIISAGEEIKLTDWNGTIWRGYIVTNPHEITYGKNFASLTLEFEGDKV